MRNMSLPPKTPPRKPMYDPDVTGRLFARNASMLRLIIAARKFLNHVSEAELTFPEKAELEDAKKKIDHYQKNGR